MGGKKGPEKNRKYEKDRRDRFNEQFSELHKLLPDFNSTSAKATKAEIISKTIQYLRDTQTQTRKFELDFENEKMKVSELQKKVAGLLQIVKELIKLLHKSNIRFPSTLAFEDFKTFQDVFTKSKNELKSGNETSSNSKSESDERSAVSKIPAEIADDAQKISTSTAVTITTSISNSSEISGGTRVTSSESPKVVKLNSNTLILPQGNLFVVNGVQNNILDYCNNTSPFLLNKQTTVPTLILMQNNFTPVNAVQHIAVTQRTQKLIMPKQTINTTKTTFINKKPIPTVRLYKSLGVNKDNVRCKTGSSRRRRSRRSKGILVKYPKRKPPTKNKKREIHSKKLSKCTKPVNNKNPAVNANNTYVVPVTESSFVQNVNEVVKTNSCTESVLNTPDLQSTGQFIDFFDHTSSRCIDNEVTGNNPSEFVQNNNILKQEKAQLNEFTQNSFDRPFASVDLDCELIQSQKEKESNKESESVCENLNLEKTGNYIQLPATSDSLLLKYTPTIDKSYAAINDESTPSNNPTLEKEKSSLKDVAPLRSGSKDLNLSLIDDKKHFESSFDEFPNDLFNTLHVPPSGHNADSISPTAAFLQTFPLVSSGANADEEENATSTTATTILQIGNLEPPSTMLFSSKPVTSDAVKAVETDVSTSYTSYCNTGLDLEAARGGKEKKSVTKETHPQQSFNFNDVGNFGNQLKTSCSKDVVSPNMSFYSATSTSTFTSYNIFTKYNDIPPPVTSSYYSLGSQPFSASKTTDTVNDFNSWIPSTYPQEDSNKDKAKYDKCSAAFQVTSEFGSQPTDGTAERPKNKKLKASNSSRPLVNWMTSPDLRNVPADVSQLTDAGTYSLPKEDATNINTFLGSTAACNTNFNSYSGNDYFLDSQNYMDPQLASCKISYSSAPPANYSWSPSKSTLPLPIDTHNMIIPSTLPTLVGDLALGNTASFNNYDLMSMKKFEPEKKKPYRNYYKSAAPNAGSFLSVTQLVDDKSLEKSAKKPLDAIACNFEEEREKCNYPPNNKGIENMDYASKKTYSVGCKETKTQHMNKCKKDTMKYQTARCVSKENKKDNRQKTFGNEYPMQSCQLQTKDVNPLSSKNSNYSAESLIGPSHQQNACSSTAGYFPYENAAANYGGGCLTNDYAKKRTEDAEPLSNVGYYANTNYVYPNNFQSFNNYGFSNQCYNNYSSQIQSGGFQKRKDDAYHAKQDSAEWSLPSYNAIIPSNFGIANQKVDSKCKQSFSANKYHHTQKNGVNSYYQAGPASSNFAQSKGNCTFNTTYSFNQETGQQCSDTNCLTSTYDMKSMRNSGTVNTSNVQSATSLTNFNLSTIFPEMNDKHCTPNRVHAVSSEKTNPKYHKGGMDDMNYNYLL